MTIPPTPATIRTMSNPAIRNGFLGGLVVLAYFLLLYTVDKQLFLRVDLQWASMVIYIAFMYQTARMDQAAHGNARDFREMLRAPFTTFLLINLCYWLFYYSLHLADPELLRLENALELQQAQAQLDAGTGDPQQANELRQKIHQIQTAPLVMPLAPILLRMCMGALGGFALSAAIVALTKKN